MNNKDLILKFYDEVFNKWDISNLDHYMHDDYKQHNPKVQDGKKGFIEFTKIFFSLKPKAEIFHIVEEENMVCVFFKCTMGANNSINKVFDMYRIENGKLAEHWDSVEHNLQNIECVHENGLF